MEYAYFLAIMFISGSLHTVTANTCDFENSQCGWYEDTIGDGCDWVRLQGSTELAPRYVGGFNNTDGHYMYLRKSVMNSGRPNNYSWTASLMSPVFSAAASDCKVNFWLHSSARNIKKPSIVQGDTTTTFWLPRDTDDQWENITVGIGKQTTPWQVGFVMDGCTSNIEGTAIDDVEFVDCEWPDSTQSCDTGSHFWCRNGACIDKDLVCDLVNNCGDNSDEMNCGSYIQCDFQNGFCDWIQVDNGIDEMDWVRKFGYDKYDSIASDPRYDHTHAIASGYYASIEAMANQYGYRAQLISPVLQSTTSGLCKMRFYYYMFNRHFGHLNIYTRIYNGETQGQTRVWQKNGYNGPFWDKGKIVFDVAVDFQVVIEATTGDVRNGNIAIDDVTFTATCVFSSIGELPNAPRKSPPPIRSPMTFHPSCNDNEFYCTLDNECIAPELVCNFRDDCLNGEEEATRCMQYSCDFESGACGWNGVFASPRELHEIPQFRWEIQQGRSAEDFRPHVDHTTTTPDGFYIFADNSPGERNTKTQITTPVIGQSGPNCHLEFWYHVGSSTSGLLKVFTIYESEMNLKFVLIDVVSNEWQRALVFIGIGERFQVAIQATRGYYVLYDICIDDVVFIDCAPPVVINRVCTEEEFRCSDGYCIDKKKVCNFVDDCMDSSDEQHCGALVGRCDFELDLCDWEQEYDQEYKWLFARGTELDHTFRTVDGQYLNARWNHQYGARLASPSIKGTSIGCRVTFWYRMYGKSIISLLVLLRTSYLDGDSSLQMLHNETGDKIYYWWPLDLTIDSRGKDFKIVIEGMGRHGYDGYVAIDDVSFSSECIGGGLLPGETSPMVPNHSYCDEDNRMLSCQDGSGCFYTWRRCNFIQDCTDNSDESSCGTSCDFESGTCGWHNSTTHGWVIMHGRPPNLFHGQVIDGTIGDDLGHYMFVVSSNYENRDLRTLPYQHSHENCQLSFRYYIYGHRQGSLSIRIKYRNHQSKRLWHATDNQGNGWYNGVAIIGRQEEFSIFIECERNFGYISGIAIDDLQFNNCSDTNYTRPCDNANEFQCSNESRCLLLDRYCDYRPDCDDWSDEDNCVAKDGDCHFDEYKPYCDYRQLNDDNFNWTAGFETPSNNSGPDYDHTAAITTHKHSLFLYIKSSEQNTGDIARIATNTTFPASNDVCAIRFWYHMYSKSQVSRMGSLRIYTESITEQSQRLLMWQYSGNLGKHWNYAKVVIGNPFRYRVVFEAIVGDPDFSDIAIDDVTFTQSCLNSDINVPEPCLRNQIYCPGDQICVDISWLNDGDVDCPADCYDEEEFRFNCSKIQSYILILQ
ncbi:MAM and LDL-receptor class A domain-containing protein 1-like [Saccoglossus kowalevskii]